MRMTYSVQGKKILYEKGKAFPPSRASLGLAEYMHIDRGDVVCDVGCGGCLLGVTASLLGAHKVYATDVDPNSVRLAKINGNLNKINNIQYFVGDCLDPIPEKVDVIVANPPQLPTFLAEGFILPVRSWIDGGADGTEFIIRLIRESHDYLKQMGRLYIPIFSLSNPAKTRDLFHNFFDVSLLETESVPLDNRHGLDKLDYLLQLREAGLLEICKNNDTAEWSIEIFEGIKRDNLLKDK